MILFRILLQIVDDLEYKSMHRRVEFPFLVNEERVITNDKWAIFESLWDE